MIMHVDTEMHGLKGNAGRDGENQYSSLINVTKFEAD